MSLFAAFNADAPSAEPFSLRFGANPKTLELVKSPAKGSSPRRPSSTASPTKTKVKVKSRSTRSGAVSARTRQALPGSVDFVKAREQPRTTSGTKRKASSSLNGKAKKAVMSPRARTVPTKKSKKTDNYLFLTEGGELSAATEELSARVAAHSPGMSPLKRQDLELSGVDKRVQKVIRSLTSELAETSGKNIPNPRGAYMKRVTLEPSSRSQNKPFEDDSLYKPSKVVVPLKHAAKGSVEWCSNRRLHALCAPGALMDISSRSLTNETKEQISHFLRKATHVEELGESYIRVRLLEHYLDLSGWTLSTVEVVSQRDRRPQKNGKLYGSPELVFNLTEEAAYGCLRLFRSVNVTISRNTLVREDRGVSQRSNDSGKHVGPETPPRELSPSAKQADGQRPSGSSDQSLPNENTERHSSKLATDEDHTDGGEEEEEEQVEDRRPAQEMLPSREFASNATQPKTLQIVGEVNGFESQRGSTPVRDENGVLADRLNGQLRDFFDRLQHRQRITATSQRQGDNNGITYPSPNDHHSHGLHAMHLHPQPLSASPNVLPTVYQPPVPASPNVLPTVYQPPVPAPPNVLPTVYYLPVPISPLGATSAITEAIVGGIRLRITQEPLDRGQVTRAGAVAETAHAVPADSDAFSDVRRERQLATNAKHLQFKQATAKAQQHTQEDDDNLLVANLLMLKTSRTSKKAKASTSKPKKKKPKPKQTQRTR